MKDEFILSDIEKAIQRFIKKYNTTPNVCILTRESLLKLRSPEEILNYPELYTIYGLKILKGDINCVSLIEKI